jgi:nucleotide-binding universal stress UspA family protein
MKVLLAVDGSKSSLKAVDCVIEHADWYRQKPEVELVTVRLPLPRVPNLGKVVGKTQIERFYQEDGEKCLAAAKRKLDAAGIRYEARVLVGQVAETIVKEAKASRCDLICLGTRGMSELGGFFVGSTATKLLHIADRPVLLAK